jgi:K+-sensing histidine kinase KdpD
MGTGLSVIARMIWGIGGRCWMSNRHDQRGIVVTLHLPMQPFDPQLDQIVLLKAELQQLKGLP